LLAGHGLDARTDFSLEVMTATDATTSKAANNINGSFATLRIVPKTVILAGVNSLLPW